MRIFLHKGPQYAASLKIDYFRVAPGLTKLSNDRAWRPLRDSEKDTLSTHFIKSFEQIVSSS